MRYIPPTFGRCIAFDPRIPHGVTPVFGANDPRHCRVVIHGWFAQPETTFFGDFEDDPEAKAEVLAVLNESLEPLIEALGTGEIGRVCGYLAVKIDFDEKNGSVSQCSAVCDTLVADPEDYRGVVGQDMEGRDVFEDPVSDVKLTVEENLGSIQISEGLSGSIVVPFVFT
uniref:Prolyl 4-hydroxylase alpha subunit Fe(2+) 2OG dioxygenase domain-containing protein n=1 Tax=Leptocylindrus danicus TaxID=163516 RepID=A0A7S2LN24_9STRA